MRKVLRNNLLMIKYVFKYVPMMVVYSILSIIAGVALNVSQLLFIQDIVDIIFENQTFDEALQPIIIYTSIVFVGLLFQTLYQRYLRHRCRYVYTMKMQRVMFEKAKRVDVFCYDDPKFFDQFTRALKEGDIKGVNVFDDAMNFFESVVNVLALGSIILLGDIYLIIFVLIQCTISFYVVGKINKIMYKYSKDTEKQRRRYAYVNRVFYLEQYVNEVKTTNINNVLMNKYKESADIEKKKYRKVYNKVGILNAINSLSYHIIRNIINYAYLGFRVLKGSISIGSFSSLISAVTKFTNNVDWLLYFVNKIKDNSLYIDDYIWFMDYKPNMETRKGYVINDDKASLKLENVYFKYNSDENFALHDINLKVKTGEKIAIVGHNGAGKTTLIKLLLKFYLPNEGNIYINEHHYKDLNEGSLRKMFATIFQNFQIYSITVAENILMRKVKSEGDIDLIWKSLEKAGLKEKIEKLPNQLNTRLTKEFDDEGLVLSGGERQKLALARVFASSAPILILDEPSSALDPIAEYEINKTLINSSKDKTVILISHRLSTVIDATRIYLVEQGKIIESGSHQELINKTGKYYEMFMKQASLYKEEMTNN